MLQNKALLGCKLQELQPERSQSLCALCRKERCWRRPLCSGRPWHRSLWLPTLPLPMPLLQQPPRSRGQAAPGSCCWRRQRRSPAATRQPRARHRRAVCPAATTCGLGQAQTGPQAMPCWQPARPSIRYTGASRVVVTALQYSFSQTHTGAGGPSLSDVSLQSHGSVLCKQA